MDRINMDFETYSEANIKEVGAHRYAEDPTTEVLCLSYAFNDEKPMLWEPSQEPPAGLFSKILKGDLIYAWNTAFEKAIWEEICVKRMGWPEIDFNQWRDTQAIALNFALPMSLENCGEVLNMSIQKDKRGKYLIDHLCKPQKKTKKNPYTRRTVETHPELFQEMYEYCIQDVESERAILKEMPWELPEQELKTWRIGLKKNDRGIPIDMELVDAVVEITDEFIEESTKMVPIITSGFAKTINQRAKIMEWCELQGYELESFTADDIDTALADSEILKFPLVKGLLEIRKLAGRSAIKKFNKLQAAVCSDNRVRDCLKYHKATTGREGGRLLQPQNLPRASVKDTEFTIDLFKNGTLEDLMQNTEDVLHDASAMIRPSICAPSGKTLLVSDYSQIEHRMTCWLADQEDVLDLIRQGRCVYTDMAAALYGMKYEDIDKESRIRRHGKLTILGGDYGMGYKKFWLDSNTNQKFDMSLEEAKKSIDTFRERHDKVVDLWKGLKEAAIEATTNWGTVTTYGYIQFMHVHGYLFMILPNGKSIAYPNARVEEAEAPWGTTTAVTHAGINPKTKKWGRAPITPGRFTENASQGSSREILMEAQIDLEEQGFKTILTVHDEVVIEANLGEHTIDEVNKILCNRSPIWDGLPLNVAGFETKRYHK